MFILQIMNNRDFKECEDKYVVTERYIDGLETCDVPRLIFDNEDDANMYVANSELDLMVHQVKLINKFSDIKTIQYLDIKCEQSNNSILRCEIKNTNNFDVPDINELNDITVFGDTVHIKKVVQKDFSLTSSKEKIISACRKIFGYVKDHELYNSYKSSYITITDDNLKKEFLELFI